MWPIRDKGLFILASYMVCSPSQEPGNGNSSLEQSDSICRWFIRPLGPFGLVKHEVKPRPLSYVISHGEPDTTLSTSIHLRLKDQSTYLLVVPTTLECFLLFVWATISSYSKAHAPFVQMEHVWEPEVLHKAFFNAFRLIGINGAISK